MERALRLVAVAVLSLAACGPGSPDGTSTSEVVARQAGASGELRHHWRHGPKLEVMTRNLYLGAEILAITQATTPAEVVALATEFWGKVQLTDFPARARVLADEIFWARPEVIGLQEVVTYRSGPGLVCAGLIGPNQPQAETVELDHLATLQRELRRRGLRYEVAARVATTDVELCAGDPADPTDPTKLRDLRYTDHEVLLVRADVAWRNPTLPVAAATGPGDSNGGLYGLATTASFDLAGATIYSRRGWTATEVRVGRRWVRVFETHLEDRLPLPAPYPEWLFQAGQAGELVAVVGGAAALAPLPTVVLGDFNVYRQPDAPSPVYDFLALGGPFPLDPTQPLQSPLEDAWTALHPSDPGFTWGFDELLRTGTMSTTLDLVLYGDGLEPVFSYLVGLHDRTRGGLHASDHLGIVTGFALPRP